MLKPKFFQNATLGLLVFVNSHIIFAHEPAEGWYASFFGGASLSPSKYFNFQHTYLSHEGRGKISYSVLADGGASIGYRCSKFRYEGELIYNQDNIRKILFNNNVSIVHDTKTQGFSLKGNTALLAGFFNAFYEFYDEYYSETKLVPYLGLGVGYAGMRTTVRFYYNQTILNQARDHLNQSSIAGQIIGGVNLFFSDNISMGTDFRYLSTKKLPRFNAPIEALNWNLLFNFSFDQPGY